MAAPALILPRKLIAIGHGGLRPTPPPLAIQWGLVRPTFYSTFLGPGTLDLANAANASNSQWFRRTAWPAASSNNSLWRSGVLTSTSLLSVSSGLLDILSNVPNDAVYAIGTAVPDGMGGIIGRSFTPPFAVSVTIKSDPTLARASDAAVPDWPAIFSVPTRFLLNTALTMVEMDYMEYFGTGTGTSNHSSNIHYWQFDSGGNIIDHVGTSRDYAAARDNNLNNYVTLVIPTTMNGGTGLVQSALNGVINTGANFTYTTSSSAGIYASLDVGSHVLMMGTGQNQPMFVQEITVWQ